MAVCNLFNRFDNASGNFMMFSQYVEDITKNYTESDNWKVVPTQFVVLDIDYTKIISVVEECAQTNKSIDIHKIYEASNNMPTDYALLWYMIYKNNLEKTYTNNDVEEIIKSLNNK